MQGDGRSFRTWRLPGELGTAHGINRREQRGMLDFILGVRGGDILRSDTQIAVIFQR